MKILLLLTFVTTVLMAQASHAGLILRSNISALKPFKEAFKETCKNTSCSSDTPDDAIPLLGVGGDIIYKHDLSVIGVGLRYENNFYHFGAKKGDNEGDLQFERTSFLLSFDMIKDESFALALIGTIGLKNKGDLKVKSKSLDTNVVNYNFKPTTETITLGISGDYKIPSTPILIGSELGYLQAKLAKSTDSETGNVREINLSGAYVKFAVGVEF